MAVDNDTRKKNYRWETHKVATNTYQDSIYYQYASLALLMDIRDELQALNRTLGCSRFQAIPSQLEVIKQNTTKRKYTKRNRNEKAT